jgi:hypothetical protein
MDSTTQEYFIHLNRWDGNSWSSEQVEQAGDYLYDIALALDPSGRPSIAYAERGTGSWVLRWDGAAWQREDLDNGWWCTAVDSSLDVDGNPAFTYESREMSRIARWNGLGWEQETVRGDAGDPSLVYTPDGLPWAAYVDSSDDLGIATNQGSGIAYRSTVADLSPGWKAAALPLSGSNDEASGNFPAPGELPGSVLDDQASGVPLVLYRYLWTGDRPARNTLRAVKSAGGVSVSY